MVETVKGLAVPLPWGLLTLPQAWSPCFLKPAFPTGQDPDGAQLLWHLELRPRHIPPRASRPGPGRGPGRRARAVGASAPGMPLASQPGGVEGLPKPWDNCSNLLDYSDDQSWGVPHTGGAQTEVLPLGERLGASGAFPGQRVTAHVRFCPPRLGSSSAGRSCQGPQGPAQRPGQRRDSGTLTRVSWGLSAGQG